MAFSKPSAGKRGYDEDEVDAFLELVETTLRDPTGSTLTAENVHQVAFSRPPIGKRGYDKDEVDAFLNLIVGNLRSRRDGLPPPSQAGFATPPASRADWPVHQPGSQYEREPDNYLVWAILCTAMCCLPVGIISVVYSVKVSGLWASGRHEEARAAAKKAKAWAIGGAVVGSLIYLSLIPLLITFIVTISNSPAPRDPSDPPGYHCDHYHGLVNCFPE